MKDSSKAIIEDALEETKGVAVSIEGVEDLVAEGVLDSLDGMVFLLEIEKRTGLKLDEQEDPYDAGWLSVTTLAKIIEKGSQ